MVSTGTNAAKTPAAAGTRTTTFPVISAVEMGLGEDAYHLPSGAVPIRFQVVSISSAARSSGSRFPESRNSAMVFLIHSGSDHTNLNSEKRNERTDSRRRTGRVP